MNTKDPWFLAYQGILGDFDLPAFQNQEDQDDIYRTLESCWWDTDDEGRDAIHDLPDARLWHGPVRRL